MGTDKAQTSRAVSSSLQGAEEVFYCLLAGPHPRSPTQHRSSVAGFVDFSWCARRPRYARGLAVSSKITVATPLETFPNPRPERDYEIQIRCPEFTSVCPKTGLPDFGEISINYVPGNSCVELKSLKFYLMSYRNAGVFYETVTNRILDDLVAACQPRRMRVTGAFTARGGITTSVVAEYTGS